MEKIDLYSWMKQGTRWFWLICGFMIIGGVGASWVTGNFIPKVYQSSVQVIVPISQADDRNISNEISTNLMQIPTYSELLKSSLVITELTDQLTLKTEFNYSETNLRSQISIKQAKESQIFEIVAEGKSAADAAIIANRVFYIFKNQVQELLSVDEVIAVTSAIPDEKPVYPNTIKNILFGALGGFMLALSFIVIYGYFDQVSTSKQNLDYLQLTDLGQMPNLKQSESTVLSKKMNHSILLKEKNNVCKTREQ